MVKISYCIVCMNRLHQLKETLLKNIEETKDDPDIEFVVLDYNSGDGMEEWAKIALADFIRHERVVYYKTNEPLHFCHSHSKNMAFKLAKGEVICSINADHFLGKGFSEYVRSIYTDRSEVMITPIDYHKTLPWFFPPKDVLGKICVKREDFMAVTGYNEQMQNYGFEDYDLTNRLEMNGIKRVVLSSAEFLKYIAHEELERFTIQDDELAGIYIKWLNPSSSEILYLYNDQIFEKLVMVNNNRLNSDCYLSAYEKPLNRFEYAIQEKSWVTGSWTLKKTGKEYVLKTKNGHLSVFSLDDRSYFEMKNKENIERLLQFKYFLENREMMEENLRKNKIVVNENGFGKGKVFKNFNSITYENI